jgi:hypothetical protein
LPRLAHRLHQGQRARQHQAEHLPIEAGMIGQDPALGEAGAPAHRQRTGELHLGKRELSLAHFPEERPQRAAGPFHP